MSKSQSHNIFKSRGEDVRRDGEPETRTKSPIIENYFEQKGAMINTPSITSSPARNRSEKKPRRSEVGSRSGKDGMLGRVLIDKDVSQVMYNTGGVAGTQLPGGTMTIDKNEKGDMNVTMVHQKSNSALMRAGSNDGIYRVLSVKKILEHRKKCYLSVRERIIIINFVRNRHLFDSLSELMDGESKVHALIWLKASGALC